MRKNKETTECEKNIVLCNVGIAQFEDGIIKCKKKNKGTTKRGKI